MSNGKRKELADTGRGPVGKTAVVGAKDRDTNQVAAKVIQSTDAETLQGFVKDHADLQATVYTDDATVCEYVKGDVHTNGIESLWSLLKRAHTGAFDKLSPKHLDRYVREFAGRRNMRALDTINQIKGVRHGMEGKRLTCQALIKDNGLKSGARAVSLA